MRNFKKILSLVLAMAMMLSVMVVGAGAAFKDEGDFSEEYVTAAEALTNLGVLKGYEDGSFQPKDTITRAETAALIYRMATGDVDDAKTGIYTQMTNGFTDVPNGQWFAGYVNFCANSQYILGMGDGTFGPQKNVTGYQTLAMILRAAGFDKDGEFAGPDWEVKTASFAEKLGVLDNVKGSEDLGAPASRELVAELLFATMSEVELVHYAPFWGYVKQGETLGEMQFDLVEVEGVVWANEMAHLGTKDKVALDAGETMIKDADGDKVTYALSTGTDIIGEQVTFWAAGDDVAVSSPVSLADTTTEWSNTTIAYLDKDASDDYKDAIAGHVVYNNYDTASTPATGKGIYVKVIDNGDGFQDFVLTEKQTMGTVEYIDNAGDVKLDKYAEIDSDDVVYDGIAKDDVVLFIEIDGTTYIEKADYVNGYISKVAHKNAKADDIATIGGNDYNKSAIAIKGDITAFADIDDTYEATYNGLTYNYYLDAYGNIRAYEAADEEATDYALILDYDYIHPAQWNEQVWVKYLTSDGKVNEAIVDTDEGNFDRINKAPGDVVKFRIDDENEFVVVYDFDVVQTSVNYVDADEDMLFIGDGSYNASDVVVFYYDEFFGDVAYGVLTGEEAIADLEGREVDVRQIEAEEATTVDNIGEVLMLNVTDIYAPATQYAYILTDAYTHTTSVDEGTLFYYDAINAAGEEIEVVTRYPAQVEEGQVWEYFEYDLTMLEAGEIEINYLDEIAENVVAGALYEFGNDLNKFVVKNAEGSFTLEVPSVFVDVEALATGVDLDREDPAHGIVIFDGDEALAVFVTEVRDGDYQ